MTLIWMDISSGLAVLVWVRFVGRLAFSFGFSDKVELITCPNYLLVVKID